MIIGSQPHQLLTNLLINHQWEVSVKLMIKLVVPMLLDEFLNILSFTKYNYHSINMSYNITAYSTSDNSI